MAYLGILMLVYALLITPLHLRLDVAAGQHVSGAIVLHIWGLRLQANLGLLRNENGKLHLALKVKGSKKQHSGDVGDTWKTAVKAIRIFRETNVTKAFFRKAVSILFVELKARLSLDDAAHTALVAGTADILLDMGRVRLKSRGIPCNLRVWPDFTGKPSAVQLSCILFMRLGNLLLGCAMAGFAVWVERRREKNSNREEERAWSTPSET